MLRPELEANSELHIRQQKAKEAVYSLKPPFPKEFLVKIRVETDTSLTGAVPKLLLNFG